ncbi:hypothetical protein B9G54_06940 [Alloscardovia macacae]|nr:hypothetical protein B9G54_06940 [Alloscardovia macacae]
MLPALARRRSRWSAPFAYLNRSPRTRKNSNVTTSAQTASRAPKNEQMSALRSVLCPHLEDCVKMK